MNSYFDGLKSKNGPHSENDLTNTSWLATTRQSSRNSMSSYITILTIYKLSCVASHMNYDFVSISYISSLIFQMTKLAAKVIFQSEAE